MLSEMQGVSISKINLSKVLVSDVDLFPCSHGQGFHCPELSGGLSTVLQHPIQK